MLGVRYYFLFGCCSGVFLFMAVKITLDPEQDSFSASEYESVLSAALKQGYQLPYGCQNGVCGSCKGKVLEGSVRYEDVVSGLSEYERAHGYALFCKAIPETDLVIEVNKNPRVMVRSLPCRVVKVERFTNDFMRLFLQLAKDQHLKFYAGQYIDLLLDGKRRSFSLANAPHQDDCLELHVRYYQKGLFSEYAFHVLQEKALLRFIGPFGDFFLRQDSTRPMIMVAGGTGFAPIKAIVENAIYTGCERPIRLYWGARQESDLYLHALAQSWADQYAHIEFVPVLSDLQLSDVAWVGRRGLVHTAVLEDFSDFSGYEVYVCGPPPMVGAVRDGLIGRGLSEQFIYSDAFEFAASSSPCL